MIQQEQSGIQTQTIDWNKQKQNNLNTFQSLFFF